MIKSSSIHDIKQSVSEIKQSVMKLDIEKAIEIRDNIKKDKRRSFNIKDILNNNTLYDKSKNDDLINVRQIISISNNKKDKMRCYNLASKENHNMISIKKDDYLSDMNIVILYELEISDKKTCSKVKNLIGYILCSITIYDIYVEDIYVRQKYYGKLYSKFIKHFNKYIKINSLKCHLNEQLSSPRIKSIINNPF